MHTRIFPRSFFFSAAFLFVFFLEAVPISGFSQDAFELWKSGPVPDAGRIGQLRAKAPTEFRPLFDLTAAYVSALHGSPPSEWLPAVQKVAALPGASPAVKEAALMWEARARMEELDRLLMVYYRKKARFPASLAEIDDAIPAELKSDPWGQPWQYQVTAPAHFPNLTGQSYRLEPGKYPGLQSLAELAASGFASPALAVDAANVGTLNAMRVSVDGGVPVILQAGLTSRNIGLAKIFPEGSLWAVDGFFIFKASH